MHEGESPIVNRQSSIPNPQSPIVNRQSVEGVGHPCLRAFVPSCLFLLAICWVGVPPVWGDVRTGGQAASGTRIADETMRAFLDHVARREAFVPEARRFVADAWAKRQSQDHPEDFLVEALAVLSPRFREGLDAFQEADYGGAFAVMEKLASGDDPYVSANASVFATKCLVEQDRLEDAAARIEALLNDPTGVDLHTYYAAEVAFLRGYVQLGNLEYAAAGRSLIRMLDRYPDAPPRFRISARQMLAELRRREPEQIGDVADLMNYAGRRLGHNYSDETVQQRQQRAIELLDRLIEEAEKKEQSSSGSGSGSGSNSNKSPSSPMQDSKLPGGGSQAENLRMTRRIRPGEAWGTMPPAEREKILQALRDSFPSRYRQLVEQYYQELAKKP